MNIRWLSDYSVKVDLIQWTIDRLLRDRLSCSKAHVPTCLVAVSRRLCFPNRQVCSVYEHLYVSSWRKIFASLLFSVVDQRLRFSSPAWHFHGVACVRPCA